MINKIVIFALCMSAFSFGITRKTNIDTLKLRKMGETSSFAYIDSSDSVLKPSLIIYDKSTHYSYFPSYLLFDSSTYGKIYVNTSDGYDDKQILISSAGPENNSARGSYLMLFGNEDGGDALLHSGDSGDLHLSSGTSKVTTLRGDTVDIDIQDTCIVDDIDIRFIRDPLDHDDENMVSMQPARSDSQILRIYGASPNPGGSIKAAIEINRGNIGIYGDSLTISTWVEFQNSLKIHSIRFGENTTIDDITIDGDSLEITSEDTIRIYMPVAKRHIPAP